MYINTNISALFAENAYNNTVNRVNQLSTELSTGLQINSPADNPAGLAISNLMQGELNGLQQASSNASQATNLLQTANGGMSTDMQILQQLQSLTTQAAQNTNNTSQLNDIQNQIDSLLNQLNNNANTVNYNNLAILNGQYSASATISTGATDPISAVYVGSDSGSGGNITSPTAFTATVTAVVSGGVTLDVVQVGVTINGAAVTQTATVTVGQMGGTIDVQLVNQGPGGLPLSLAFQLNQANVSTTAISQMGTIDPAANTLSFQIGAQQGSADVLTANLGNFDANSLGLTNLSVVQGTNVQQNTDAAQYAQTQVQNAIEMLSNAQGYVGALMDQLQYTSTNLQTEQTNLAASQATILDANIPSVAQQYAQQTTLLQSGVQALSQANQLPQLLLKLIG
ncbi:flagellin [Sulfobacillus thermosulfidooxidans]|uniref:flagellin N-terminal helical domain-containing protein n=1 Tax=Sulfobacillus thermosulfidooxidans TaxID=28034 RepID=UPI0002DC5306|nr:flagellin [Sulfobacillus thermosulfidooxidans]